MEHDAAYERLLNFLAAEDETDEELDEDVLNEMVAETAARLSDRRAAVDDLAGAAVWQQVSVDARGSHQADALEQEFISWLDACGDGQDRRN